MTTSSTSRGQRLMTWARAGAVLPAAFAVVLASGGTAHAAGASISNGGSRTFGICHNAASETACASGTGTLSQGQNSRSKYGWDDTDMIRIPAGCRAQHNRPVPPTYVPNWVTVASAGSSARWFKVTDNAGGGYRILC